MTNVNHKTIFFLGIGGIGMSALAKFFIQQKAYVYGYDLTPTKITDELSDLGAKIHFEDNPELLPEYIDFAIYTPAIPKNHKELNFIKTNKIHLLKRSQILGEISKSFNTIAVAGTHGKTTTSAICAQLFKEAGININAFIGGIANNFKSNYLFDTEATTLIVEADEFDRSFLTLNPSTAIITSMDADHLDIYNNPENLITSFNDFIKKIKLNGFLVYNSSLSLQKTEPINYLSYSLNDTSSDIFAFNIKQQNAGFAFDLKFKNKIYTNIIFNYPGTHNLENAIAACGALLANHDVNEHQLSNALGSFTGVHRRFEIVLDSENTTLIDDYAHHPTEIKSCLKAVKSKFPNKKITIIFQPHLYSRTKDFADDFAKELSVADNIILLPIYPAREEPIEGINSEFLLNKINNKNKILINYENLVNHLSETKHQIIVIMGAGNIDKLVPLVKNQLEKINTL
jgi:UDP-N-acetylmuramate--alanine ligase